MNKKTVFLLGDIGKDKHGLYHVGDEAMFLSNLESYQKLHINVFASSRSISHKDLLKNEVLDIYITNLFQFLILTSKSLLLRYLSVNTFPVFFRNTIKALTTADVLHISGGGNITSLWSGHIYYRSFMIFLAKK